MKGEELFLHKLQASYYYKDLKDFEIGGGHKAL